jgi:hypothetical protein
VYSFSRSASPLLYREKDHVLTDTFKKRFDLIYHIGIFTLALH